jgi:hypothetical protein
MFLAAGVVAFAGWRLTGNDAWVERFFRVPGSLLIVALASAQLWLSSRIWAELLPGDPLRGAWLLIGLSAACDLCGAIAAQALGDPGLRLLAYVPGLPPSVPGIARQCGLVLGGACRFALLTAGLLAALKIYRKAAFLGRLKAPDWVLLAVFGGYIVREAADLVAAIRAGRHPGFFEAIGWPVDPLLALLLAEALLLFRSTQRMGSGWISSCWRAFSVGIVLILLGDAAIWAAAYGYLPWPWSALEWFVWTPAAGAFALGPAYQLEAIQHASAPAPAPRLKL